MMTLALLALLCLPQAPPATQGSASFTALQDELGREFRAYYSLHFQILSDADRNVVRKVESLAEDTFRSVLKWNATAKFTNEPAATSMPIVLFKGEREFTRFLRTAGMDARPDIPGYYDERRDICVIVDSAGMEILRRKRDELFIARRESSTFTQDPGSKADVARTRRLEQIRQVETQIAQYEQAINSTVIRHEIAHMVLAHLGLQRAEDMHRRWLKEGLAMQFENPDGINAYRLADFQNIPTGDRKRLFRELINNSAGAAPGANQAAQAYALSWALVGFLSNTQRDLFRQYMMNPDPGRVSELDRFERHFGEIDDHFVTRLGEYIRNSAS